jgi:hypothetical protein
MSAGNPLRLRGDAGDLLRLLADLVQGGPLSARHWPPLPPGRRPRALERERRRRLVVATRSALLAVLVRRLRAELGIDGLPPCPPHGLRCPPGCAECHAIRSWRVMVEVVTGADARVHRYMFP